MVCGKNNPVVGGDKNDSAKSPSLSAGERSIIEADIIPECPSISNTNDPVVNDAVTSIRNGTDLDVVSTNCGTNNGICKNKRKASIDEETEDTENDNLKKQKIKVDDTTSSKERVSSHVSSGSTKAAVVKKSDKKKINSAGGMKQKLIMIFLFIKQLWQNYTFFHLISPIFSFKNIFFSFKNIFFSFKNIFFSFKNITFFI